MKEDIQPMNINKEVQEIHLFLKKKGYSNIFVNILTSTHGGSPPVYDLEIKAENGCS